MIWAGRVNAIVGLLAAVGVVFLIAALCIDRSHFTTVGILFFLAFTFLAAALLLKAGTLIADAGYRAVKGEPLIYEQRVSLSDGKTGRIAE